VNRAFAVGDRRAADAAIRNGLPLSFTSKRREIVPGYDPAS
jgi:hypothetical protein